MDNHFLIYFAPDGKAKIDVRLEGETLWLTQGAMADLFDTTKQNISRHVKNILAEGELTPEETINKSFTVKQEGSRQVRRAVTYYNLDMIISVGYRIKSSLATRFRIWATRQLREYIVKGFVLNDDRFKKGRTDGYFEELLYRIRDIRSSEKVFWRKVLSIYATSVDYNKDDPATREFFRAIQNKMHGAVHGKTAAELILERADASAPNMGLTHWEGTRVRKQDISVAKNYLTAEEADMMNKIVTLFLDFAELQALNRTPMYMKDWLAKLEDFLRFTGRQVVTPNSAVTHEIALEKASKEYEKYRRVEIEKPSRAEIDFLALEQKVHKLKKMKKKG